MKHAQPIAFVHRLLLHASTRKVECLACCTAGHLATPISDTVVDVVRFGVPVDGGLLIVCHECGASLSELLKVDAIAGR